MYILCRLCYNNNMKNLNKIKPLLARTITFHPYGLPESLLERVTEMSHNIADRNTSSRSYEQIYKDTLQGVIREYAVAQFLDGYLNPKQFDISDRDSYGWDVGAIIHGETYRFEVKPTPDTGKYFSFSESIYRVLQNNIMSGVVDAIITVAVTTEEDGTRTCRPRHLIPVNDFEKNVHKSMYANRGRAYYFNHKSASHTIIRSPNGERIS